MSTGIKSVPPKEFATADVSFLFNLAGVYVAYNWQDRIRADPGV